ncbi:MAG TPA: hypothetical protein VFL12_13325 [Thermoanaerobaculia bacterium]|nr:hypothetical protein [Thermoanaerobaculia bacterium]
MKSVPIVDGSRFRKDVELNSGARWAMAVQLAEATGILSGPDGPSSCGIWCERCRFGFRREFGPYPMAEARTSLAHDFTDEAHRRECAHWKAFLDHPQAFSGPKPLGAELGTASVSFPAPAEANICERCSVEASALFRCLGSRVCFRCLGAVLQATGGYRGLKALTTVEPAPDPKSRRLRRDPTMGRCRTCRVFGRVIPIHGYKYCRPCATAKVERLLSGG